MELKIAPNDLQSMSQDGDAILRSLQNITLPITDLLVRESLQNSLDAAIEGEKFTTVDFTVGEFDSEKLSKEFNGISNELQKRFTGRQEFLSISDKKTIGLTGDYASEDSEILNSSNFHKLVFGIGKNQEKEGAGGSWGLGKTSYFRIGVGIVIYYTRIKNETGFEERLIGSLIESPKQKNRLLEKAERGIAWWGEYASDKERIFPIVESEEIRRILSLFNLEPYKNEETGTTIIIPYLNNIEEDLGLADDVTVFPWEKSREMAIKLAIQRWYFPRLNNMEYSKEIGNSALLCTVNGLPLLQSNFEPIIKVYQEVYNAALKGKSDNNQIIVSDVKFGRTIMANKNDVIGRVAFYEVSEKELGMLPPENKRPGAAYLGFRDSDALERNDMKIMGFCRKPGMVIEYTNNRKWLPYDIKQKDNHLLISFFVPNSSGKLIQRYSEQGYKDLESYLRSTENSDHANWADKAGIGIIDRIQKYSKSAILEYYKENSDENNQGVTSGLSRKYGALFMPPRNFGRNSTLPAQDKDSKDKKEAHLPRGKKSEVVVVGSSPKSLHSVEVEFKAFIREESASVIYLQVETQEKRLNYIEWKKGMDNVKFPFKINNVYIKAINDEVINEDYTRLNREDFKIILSLENNLRGVTFVNHSLNRCYIEGKIIINIESQLYQPILSIQTVNEEEGD